MKPEVAYLGFGGNLGDVQATFSSAITLLAAHPSLVHKRSSELYRTSPWGRPNQPEFLNFVEEIECNLSPESLLEFVLSVERRSGRNRKDQTRWGPRTLDIDLLIMGDRIVNTPMLRLPHPRLHERKFVLQPLAELCPDLLPPGLNRNIRELLDQLDSDEKVVSLGTRIEPRF